MQVSKLFEDVVSDTIKWETGGDKSGAYTDDPNDAGRATKWGISQAANPDINIKALTYKEAVNIYFNRYWNPLYDLVPDPVLVFKLFDMGVLNGVRTAVKYLQKSIRKQGHTIKVDGVFGVMTLTAVNLCYGEGAMEKLYENYVNRFKKRVLRIVTIKPWQLKYFNGWVSRIVFKFNPPKPELASVTGGMKKVTLPKGTRLMSDKERKNEL